MPHQFAIVGVLAVAACSSSVGEGDVVKYLRAQPPAVRAKITAASDDRPRRTDVIGRSGTPLTLVGATLDVGDAMPAVDLVDEKLVPLRLGELRGTLVVLSVVPSIDTRVCESQTHHMSDAIAQMPAGTVVITVSRDLPFAQERFAEEAKTQTRMASDYKGGGFGRAFGVEVEDSGLLARSVA
jgi:thioredoxin-dependent peroxiredoxin